MRALKFHQTGSLDDLRIEEVSPPIPAAGEVLVQVKAAALNPSDVKNVQGRGADIVFDVVGVPMFEKCLAALAWRGRQVAISSSPDHRVNFNLVDFYHNESRLLGVDSLKLSFEETAEILRQLTPGIESGIFPPPSIQIFSLEEGPRLYQDIAQSKIKGKPILVPCSKPE